RWEWPAPRRMMAWSASSMRPGSASTSGGPRWAYSSEAVPPRGAAPVSEGRTDGPRPPRRSYDVDGCGMGGGNRSTVKAWHTASSSFLAATSPDRTAHSSRSLPMLVKRTNSRKRNNETAEAHPDAVQQVQVLPEAHRPRHPRPHLARPAHTPGPPVADHRA